MRTSGLAWPSGITVMISLAGLFMVDSTTIRSMAMGAIIVVAISILAAVTLLPALMAVLGRRAYCARAAGRPGIPGRAVGALAPPAPGRTDPDHAGGLLAAVDRPGDIRSPRRFSARRAAGAKRAALSLQWGDGALRQFPEGNETRVGAELAAQATGPGASGPLRFWSSSTPARCRTPGTPAR